MQLLSVLQTAGDFVDLHVTVLFFLVLVMRLHTAKMDELPALRAC